MGPMRRPNWLERYAVLLPISVLVAILTWVSAGGGAAYLWVSRTCLLASPVMFGAAVQTYRSRDHAGWSAVGWLPLRGRWLCYFVSALLALPLILAGVLFALVVVQLLAS